MTSIVTVLTEGFADWEPALLNAVAHTYYGIETRYASPGGKPVTSSGGMRVNPTLAVEALQPGDYDALVVSGGTAWQQAGAPDIGPQLRAARDAGKVVGLICDGTIAGARAGLLDDIPHTSNGVGYLGSTGYKGKAHYEDTAHAVVAGKVVTAAGTSSVSFASAMLKVLGVDDGKLDHYIGLHGAQFDKAA